MRGNWFLKLVAITLGLAVALHIALVQFIPTVITSVFMARVKQQVGANRVVAGPLPTDKSRGVVKPSPDLLYAVCIYDVGAGPVHMTIAPPETYWSLSLFARNTDNFFKLSAADVKAGAAEIVLGRAQDADAAKIKYPAATFVVAPGASGVMLARVLVLDQSNMAAALAAQKSVRCEASANRS